MSTQNTDALIEAILGPNLQAATERLIAYTAIGVAALALIIRLF